MAQMTYCDLCKEIIKQGDKKYIFALYLLSEEDEETRRTRYEEILKALSEGRCMNDNHIKVAEVCERCASVFAHFLNLRKKELIKSRREVKRMLSRKTRKEKIKEIKKLKEKKSG